MIISYNLIPNNIFEQYLTNDWKYDSKNNNRKLYLFS